MFDTGPCRELTVPAIFSCGVCRKGFGLHITSLDEFPLPLHAHAQPPNPAGVAEDSDSDDDLIHASAQPVMCAACKKSSTGAGPGASSLYRCNYCEVCSTVNVIVIGYGLAYSCCVQLDQHPTMSSGQSFYDLFVLCRCYCCTICRYCTVQRTFHRGCVRGLEESTSPAHYHSWACPFCAKKVRFLASPGPR